MAEAPVRDTFLPFSRPSISEDEIAAVGDVLRSGWITTGPKTKEFEARFAEYCGVKNALAVTSGTAAQHLLMLALGIGPGDEVVTTPMTWATTANMVAAVGATPVFADVDERTFLLDPAEVAKKITPRTKAIIPVHFGGLPADLDALRALAEPRGILVLEDAAHAVGTQYKGRTIGSHGNPAMFSLHPIKNVTTGEGGFVTTDDDELARKIRLYRFHGVNRDSWSRGRGGAAGYDIEMPGFKYNLTDIQSAIGLGQLSRLEGFIARRAELAARYLKQFDGMDEIRPCAADAGYPLRHAWNMFTILVDPDRLTIDRFEFMDALKAENVGTGLHFIAVHLHPFYAETYGCRRGDFPRAEKVSDRILTLPLFPAMADKDVDDVVAAVQKVVRAHRRTA